MKLSVIIPTRNRRALLARTLPSVLGQDVAHDEYEVLVVSDGSTDGTVEFVREFKTQVDLRVLDRPHRGIAASQNAGIEAARGELVLVLDDDMVCEPGILRKHIAAHRNEPPCVVICPRLISPESRPGLATEIARDWYRDYADRVARERGPRNRFDVWMDSNFSVPRDLLLAHGGFDETLRYAEDREIAIRLWAAGVPFKLLPDARAFEIYSKTIDDVAIRNARVMGADEIRLSRKHPDYKPLSLVADLIGESRRNFMAYWLCCIFPFSPEIMLRIPSWLAERFRHHGRTWDIASRLFSYRKSIVMMRSAVREAGSWPALHREFLPTLPILTYHRIGTPYPGTNYSISITRARFERQMRWLADHGYASVGPSDWLAWVKEGKPLPDRPVMITFDDGYAEAATDALPLVKKYGFKATVYVVTSRLGGTNGWDDDGAKRYPLMTADEIKNWRDQGIEFGGHTRTHPDLRELDATSLLDEVEGSAFDLEKLLGQRPVSFAYPFGGYNSRVADCVRSAFPLALTCETGLNYANTDPVRMRRVQVRPEDSLLEFLMEMRMGSSPLDRLRDLTGHHIGRAAIRRAAARLTARHQTAG
jgi:peptidoglycan/xylan/chitin deacetylase (PgdA/CDA1 family)/glycosyltransferase involved in cell wall biosynthesis